MTALAAVRGCGKICTYICMYVHTYIHTYIHILCLEWEENVPYSASGFCRKSLSLAPFSPKLLIQLYFFSLGSFQFLLNEMGGCWVFDWHLVCTACIHLPEKGHCTIKDCQRQPRRHFWAPRPHSQQHRSPPRWKETSSLIIMGGGVISKVIKIFLYRQNLSSFHPSDLFIFYPCSVLLISKTPKPSLAWRETLLE